MSRKIITGVLEHLLFELIEKNISYEIRDLGKKNGYPEQITLIIKEKNLFVYIMKNEKKMSYYISKTEQKKKLVSKQTLLEKIKDLK